MEWWFYLPVVVWSLFALVTGLMVGSFINVLAARLPYEKSVVWPPSHCFACFRRVRTLDNVPVLGFLRLGGKCRHCGTPFSSRYLWVELGTGIAFLALFLVEVVFDWFKLPGIKYELFGPGGGAPSWRSFAVFLYHATLLSGLIAAAVVDAEHRIIPTQVTYTVMAVGILGGALMPWPWPHGTEVAHRIPIDRPWFMDDVLGMIPLGVQPWPFWGPTFVFAPPGTWQIGILNAVIGALVGSLVVRVTKWLFETGLGREALGLGDADLLMMAGAFLGWQIPVLSLFTGAIAALVLKALAAVIRPGVPAAPVAGAPVGTPVTGPPESRELPFGPGLAIGVVVTWFAWPWLAPKVQFPFFDSLVMGVLVTVMGVGLLAAALLLRKPTEPATAAAK
jgi:leader peptidase (prepilin peptidase)/N-methyltransferase